MIGSMFSRTLSSIVSTVVPFLVIVALAMLWRRQRSPWLVLAIAAETIGVVCRFTLFAIPELARTTPTLFSIWTLSGLAFAVGLLGYAIETTRRP